MIARDCLRLIGVLFAALFFAVNAPAQDAAKRRVKADIDFRTPAREFETVPVGKRKFIVEKQLVVEAPDLAKRTLKRLNDNIELALRILPPHSHAQIGKQQFYLMYGPKARGGGWDRGVAYYRPGSPKFDKRRHQDWNSVIVIFSADNYAKLTDLWALKSVMHEMAHAYHLEQWPEKEPAILAAWENSAADELYRNIKDNKGRTLQAAYATTNQLEYFAELSCMFFARCHYPPFNRAELKTYDPTGYEMIRKQWKIGDKYGKREARTWKVGTRGRTLIAALSAVSKGRVTLTDSKGRDRTISVKALSPVDQEHILLWLGGTGGNSPKKP